MRAVTRRYGAHGAVQGVSLDLAGGEFVSLLGPSGCGKSTLLRLIAGLERPDAGQVWLDGADITGVPAHRRPVNLVFQSYALFPHLTVAGNVGFGLRQERLPRAEIARRVDAALALVQLQDLRDRLPHQLSGGQAQRVALARALAKRPRVLLLDEPLSALDAALRERTRTQLRALQKQLGTAFLMVTHDREEALALSDRVAVMDGGQLLAVGAPQALYQRPPSAAVAVLLGEANLLPCVVRHTATGARADCAALGLADLPVTASGVPDGPAQLLLRPHAVRVRAGDAAGDGRGVPGGVSVPATLTHAAYAGAAWNCAVQAGAHTLQGLWTGSAAPPAPGAPVQAGFAPADCVALA